MAAGIESIETSEDLQMVSNAITRGWEIPAAVFKALPGFVLRVLADPKSKTRERLRATQVLMKMAAQNKELFDTACNQDGISVEQLMAMMTATTAIKEPEQPSE